MTDAPWPTERRHPEASGFNALPAAEQITIMLEALDVVTPAVAQAAGGIGRTVAILVERFAAGGRLILCGAGTSGRLAVMEAAECPPTFGTAPERIIGLMAGGAEAVFQAREGAEDDLQAGEQAMVQARVGPADVVIGISASGRTRYVLGALEMATGLGAHTVLLTANPPPAGVVAADVLLTPTGPEIVAGSTRLAAASAHKRVLNTITTITMIRLGIVQDGRMLRLGNHSAKLRERAARILAELEGLELDVARRRLAAAGGCLEQALAEGDGESPS